MMTSLRGPDPYAEAEAALARLLAQPAPTARALCQLLHEAIPTYTWVGLVRVAATGGRVMTQHGAIQREATLPNGCLALLAHPTTLVIDDVVGTAAYHECCPDARALIAVPLGSWAVLVVTSAYQGAFGLTDRDLLAMVARRWAASTAT